MLRLATVLVLASLLLAAPAQAGPWRTYWSPLFAETRLSERGVRLGDSGMEHAQCRGFGRDRLRAPKGGDSKYVFRAFNCRVGNGEVRALLVLSLMGFRLLDGPLAPDPAP